MGRASGRVPSGCQAPPLTPLTSFHPSAALLLTLASIGLLFSLYLSYLQLFEIKAICFWCVVSALIELGIWVAALLDWRQVRSG